jgi:hypothetical protein
MSQSAKSILAFGIYVTSLGLVLLLIPNQFLGLFGFQPTDGLWVRVLGMILVLLSYYYIQAARNELTVWMRWTVHARSTIIIFFTVFVLIGLAPPILIAFAFVDLGGAIWTHMALRSSKAVNL